MTLSGPTPIQRLPFRLRGLTLLLVAGVLAIGASAQTGKGVILGQVADTANAVLQGAQVQLSNGMTVASGPQGEFTIVDVPAGTYDLTISYLGFLPFTQSVTVTAGQFKRVDAVLQVASSKTEMTVFADRQFGEAEAINRERTSDNILAVLPAEVITSLPNANVADAIGRLPSVTLERDEGEGKYVQIRGTEPRLSNVTINGIVIASPEASQRQVKLDIINSTLVDSVEINKTLSPNQDADAIGGSVNLVTKNAPEQPYISINGYGGFTAIQNNVGLGQLDATVGRRFGANKKFGIMVGGAFDYNGRGIDDIEPAVGAIQCDPGNCGNPSSDAPYFPTVPTMDQRLYQYQRSRWGFAGGTDYKLNNEGSGLFLRGLYSHFDNFGNRWVYTPTINSFTDSPLQGGTDGTMSSNAQIRRPVYTIGSADLSGRHVLGSSLITWGFAASRSVAEDKGYSSADFFNVDPAASINNVQFGLDRTNPFRPKFVVQNGVNIYDPTQYYLQDLDVNHTFSPQLNLQGAASYARNFKIKGHFSTFEMGGLFRNAHKFQNSNDVYYNVNDPTAAPMSTFVGGPAPPYYFGSYKQGPLVDYNKVLNYFWSNPDAFTLDYNQTQIKNNPNNYNLVEQVSAGYLMDTIDWNKFRLVAGVRFEGTSENVKGYHVTIDSSGNYVSTEPLQVNSGYLNVLPSAQLRYTLTPDSALRVSYGQGIARPNFGDLPPYVVQNDKKNSISVGNPYLKATRANNYDIQYEHFLKPLGAIRGGFFYKSIYNPIYYVDTTVESGPYAGFTQTQPINGTSADLWGMEISYIQQLTFLPSYLSSGGISANYSYTHSTANGVPNRTGPVALQRQAPNTWNISPTWDRGRVSVRVGITHNGPYIFQYNYADGAPLGPTGPNGDIYLYAHTQIDAQGTVRIARGWSAMVAGLNLNNACFGFYQGSPQYPIQREYYGPSFQFGFRWLPGSR